MRGEGGRERGRGGGRGVREGGREGTVYADTYCTVKIQISLSLSKFHTWPYRNCTGALYIDTCTLGLLLFTGTNFSRF